MDSILPIIKYTVIHVHCICSPWMSIYNCTMYKKIVENYILQQFNIASQRLASHCVDNALYLSNYFTVLCLEYILIVRLNKVSWGECTSSAGYSLHFKWDILWTCFKHKRTPSLRVSNTICHLLDFYRNSTSLPSACHVFNINSKVHVM